jgi:hypothetical protein
MSGLVRAASPNSNWIGGPPQLGDGYIGLVFPGVPNEAIVCFQLNTGERLARRLILFIEFFVEMDMSELTPAEGRIC